MTGDQYYVRRRGKVTGPYAIEQLAQLRDQGRLTRIQELSTDGKMWMNAADVFEVFPQSSEMDLNNKSLHSSSASDLKLEPDRHAPPPPQEPGPRSGSEWYYAVNDQQLGPVSFDAMIQLVKSGVATPETMVWTEGMGDWAPASQTIQLVSYFPSSPGPSKAVASEEEGKNRVVAGLLALFLGTLGVHRFYLGHWWGVVYPAAIFGFGFIFPFQFARSVPQELTLASMAIACVIGCATLIEALVIFCTSDSAWRRKYGG